MNEQVNNQTNNHDDAARALRAVVSYIAHNPEVRELLPPDTHPAFVSALTVGVAARMAADLLLATMPKDHLLTGAIIEYISMSMGALCHYTQSPADEVSEMADKVLELLNKPPAVIAPGDVGTPGIVQMDPADSILVASSANPP